MSDIDKTSHIIKKYQNISENFGLEVTEMVEEMTSVIEEKKTANAIAPIQSVSTSLLIEDFTFVRSTLLEAIEDGKNVLKAFSNELLEEGTDAKPGILMGYSELMVSINQNIKLLVSIYKEIVKTEVEINKSVASKPNEQGQQGNIYINNNFVSTTSDIIAKYSKGTF